VSIFFPVYNFNAFTWQIRFLVENGFFTQWITYFIIFATIFFMCKPCSNNDSDTMFIQMTAYLVQPPFDVGDECLLE